MQSTHGLKKGPGRAGFAHATRPEDAAAEPRSHGLTNARRGGGGGYFDGKRFVMDVMP